MMHFHQTKDHRILQLEEELEDLIGNKDKMNPDIYAAEYRLITEDLFYTKNRVDYLKKKYQVSGQSLVRT